jgi:type II secretory pathway component PulF
LARVRFSHQDKWHLYSELEKLAGAGFSIADSIETVLEQRPPPGQGAFLKELKAGLDAHKTVGDSVAAIRGVVVTPLESTILSAAEKGGHLPEGFGHLSEYFAMAHRTAREIKGKLIYPLVLLHCGILIPAAPKLILAPDKKAVVFQTLGLLLGLYLVVGSGILLFRQLHRNSARGVAADGFLRKIPMVGKVRQALAMSRFTKVFEIFLLAGQRMDTGLKAASEAAQSGLILDAVTREVIPVVRAGNRAGPALNHRAFPPAFARSYVTAEKAGSLDKDMHRWAIVYQEEALTRMERLASAVPKIIYGFIVIFVVWQILSMYMGYLGGMMKMIDEI